MRQKPNYYPVQAYVKPKYLSLISGQSKMDGASKSEVVAKAVEKYFDEMPSHEREKILSIDKAVR